jgi:hypothetical protein
VSRASGLRALRKRDFVVNWRDDLEPVVAARKPSSPWRKKLRPGTSLPDMHAPPSVDVMRQDFAARVVRRLTEPDARVAVIDDAGRPAMVARHERLFDVLAKDHPIVGVYAPGARVRDVIDDLKAAGL